MSIVAPTAIVAHGKNWEVPVPADPAEIQLSLDSRLTAVAAGVLYMAGVADKIIFSTGHTAGEEYPTEAAAQLKEMRRFFGPDQIPEDDVMLEEDSFDTAGNVEQTRRLIDEGHISGAHLLTLGYHLPRLGRLARRQGIPILGMHASDKVVGRSDLAVPDLRGRSHYYGRLVLREAQERRSVRPLVRTAAQFGLEAAGHALMTVDPSGKGVSRLATKRLRHHAGD
ncbi:MAG TPA: YdcF family protein [Patescibacteria group bacterium]|nr:YdcF family protein [Patescibacteria group bacterium]